MIVTIEFSEKKIGGSVTSERHLTTRLDEIKGTDPIDRIGQVGSFVNLVVRAWRDMDIRVEGDPVLHVNKKPKEKGKK